MEFADVPDDEIEGPQREVAIESVLLAMEEELKRFMAKQTNKIIAITLAGLAAWVVIISILVALD